MPFTEPRSVQLGLKPFPRRDGPAPLLHFLRPAESHHALHGEKVTGNVSFACGPYGWALRSLMKHSGIVSTPHDVTRNKVLDGPESEKRMRGEERVGAIRDTMPLGRIVRRLAPGPHHTRSRSPVASSGTGVLR